MQVSPPPAALMQGAGQFLDHIPFMFAPSSTSPIASFINAEARQTIIVHHGGVRPWEILTRDPPPPGIILLPMPIIPTTLLRGKNTLKHSLGASLEILPKVGAILFLSHSLKKGKKPQVGHKDTLGVFIYIKNIMMKASPLLLNSLKNSLPPLLPL